MAIYKNVASQKFAVFAYDSTDGSAKTGDAAQITAQISKDGAATAATNDVAPTELDAVDAPGIYIFDMTQAETNADLIVLAPVSSTGDILLDPLIIYTTPGDNVALDANVKEVSDDSAAANNLELACDNYSATRGLTGTALPAVAADGAGGVPISVAGGLDLDTQLATTDQIGAAGVGLAEAGGDGDHLTAINLPNQTMDITGNLSGSVGSVTGAVGSVTGHTVQTGDSFVRLGAPVAASTSADIAALNDVSAADVNAEVVDALATDTYAEPGQEDPVATSSLANKINYCFKFLRNKIHQDATTLEIYNDAGAVVDHKATVSDDGVDYVRGEIGTGP